MNMISTRGQSESLSFSQALERSIAKDGGLFVPDHFPSFEPKEWLETSDWKSVGKKLLKPFLQGDALDLRLDEICERAFNFDIPLKYLINDTAVLELFRGPTAAFKDVGARFLAEALPARHPKTILVATSGDTGGAVASAFYGKARAEVVILFPEGKISARQEKQLTCWGGNVRALSVSGDFDDCQRVVKEAFADSELRNDKNLLSANSINLGRLLPQTVYYAWASMNYFKKTGKVPGFIIPTGNLGNGIAAFWAKKMGFPIRKVLLATNANRPIPDFLTRGHWKPNTTIATLANAMDVGNPSNMERLLHLYPDLESLKKDCSALSVTDEVIRKTITEGPGKWGEIWCPHTATAVHFREQELSSDWIIVATAHPAKFDTVVEPLIGKKVDVPPSLSSILSRSGEATSVSPTLQALKSVLSTY